MSRGLKRMSGSGPPGQALAIAVVLHTNFNSYKTPLSRTCKRFCSPFYVLSLEGSMYCLIAKAFRLIPGLPVEVSVDIHMLAIVPIHEINMVRIYHEISFCAWYKNLIVLRCSQIRNLGRIFLFSFIIG